MGHAFGDIAFTPTVKALQETNGSRANYARMAAQSGSTDVRLTDSEAAFIGARDSFYMATVGETGWPYVQHRGGPIGFVRMLDEQSIGFADFIGNRQYVSVGNLTTDDRVSLFFMDYPNRRRLKLLGHVRLIDPAAEPDLLERLAVPGYKARVQRGFAIKVAAFDWNCPQHITPRYTEADVAQVVSGLTARIAELEARLAVG